MVSEVYDLLSKPRMKAPRRLRADEGDFTGELYFMVFGFYASRLSSGDVAWASRPVQLSSSRHGVVAFKPRWLSA